MRIKKIHFMGLGGSGISGVAAIAQKQGYIVSGCDSQVSTPYLDKIKKLGIRIDLGHNVSHLSGCDLLVVSPAILYTNANHPEYVGALDQGKAILWNKFVGKYLLEDKDVVAISGTHGKGTVTAMISMIFEEAGLDPSVIIGATVPKWEANYRVGNSENFIIEADEFYEKFLDYNPSTAVVNNIEFDHPDYFEDENSLISSFKKFIELSSGRKNVVLNLDSPGVIRLYDLVKGRTDINFVGFSSQERKLDSLSDFVSVKIVDKLAEGSNFRVHSNKLGLDGIFSLSLTGEHNVSNAVAAIIVARLYGIPSSKIKGTLVKFNGLGRRFEKVYDKKGIIVYDDYAHHPTAIKVTLEAIRQRHPFHRIICIVEPHSYSRTKALLSSYKGVFEVADKVIVGPIFKARDSETFGVSGNDIVNKSNHKDAVFLKSVKQIVTLVPKILKENDVVVVMGAGESYLWTKEIVKQLD
jgi:UDP-N-acetylmuramate--alanine ligase